jgi:hypothetical protein
VHALLQHSPSTQKPDWHCAFIAHADPLPRSPTHAPPTQLAPAAQSPFPPQDALHAPVAPSQMYGLHAVAFPLFVQTPAPSHAFGCDVLPTQLKPQLVPAV